MLVNAVFFPLSYPGGPHNHETETGDNPFNSV